MELKRKYWLKAYLDEFKAFHGMEAHRVLIERICWLTQSSDSKMKRYLLALEGDYSRAATISIADMKMFLEVINQTRSNKLTLQQLYGDEARQKELAPYLQPA